MRYQGYDTMLSFWITPETYQRIKEHCSPRGMSKWLRKLVLAELEREAAKVSEEENENAGQTESY